ncbi:hypothetical protein SAMN02744124_02223 [Paenibacillus barengoltzii J12]|uniref:Uncharacterized protein n=1 Tax=Paenibacillus barengoltzii J12 TaxID=935846 RepID=A0ABY1LXN4_9BACL|nr:hypothetical protein SAMN02744102_00920 [Paenibacillus barengoltzii]SMF27694.1 hypothetical protein SAMN02744124_02223 [Paenibacillus barengoltzii J12]
MEEMIWRQLDFVRSQTLKLVRTIPAIGLKPSAS